jgi:hypothetical protein
MKRVLSVCAFLILGFVAGLATAKYLRTADDEEFRRTMLQFNARSMVAFALSNIRNSENGDIPAVIALNCRIAKSSLRLVDANYQQSAEVVRLSDQAHTVISGLESTGKCSKP